ncbi:hypothetical protein PMSD_03120 [Paenibacillus macquariensis subsp. defensor]|nr:hypothetical protein PMSD_03120 [Paenibacillus macquariensis subsp. defensor]
MGKNIGEMRTERGYTLQEVAAYAHISVETLKIYELNASEMSMHTAMKLLRLYRIPAHSISFN